MNRLLRSWDLSLSQLTTCTLVHQCNEKRSSADCCFGLLVLLQISFLKWLLSAWSSIIHHHACMYSQEFEQTSNCWIHCQGVLRCCCREDTCVVNEEGCVNPLTSSSLFFVEVEDTSTANLTTPCHCSICHAVYSYHAWTFSHSRGITVLKTLSWTIQIWSEIKLFVDQESQFLTMTFFTISILNAITTHNIFLPCCVY